MKFGHVFKQTLKNEGFPPDWVESAISYSQLKKCINRLTSELSEVGLNPQTLARLIKQVEERNAKEAQENTKHADSPLEYLLNHEDGPEKGGVQKPFQPKLLFHVNEKTGELDSAMLDEETKKKLHMLALESGLTDLRVLEEPDDSKSIESGASSHTVIGHECRRRPGYKTVEVQLTSDSEFFTKLSSELSGLETLQDREEKRMHDKIEELGKQVAKLTDPDRRSNKKLIAVWRQIFQIYVENDIFFGTRETDHGGHDAGMAAQRFQKFANTIAQQGLVDKFKKPECLQALTSFMNINREILQGLKFGEINRTAMTKILKKFDKQTNLNVARSTFPLTITYPSFSSHLAKAVCSELNTSILSHVPQIDDYSCPMCMEIKWRPVKLSCGHVFCIRCLIVMQTNKQHLCPLCRQRSVVDANSDNLDLELADFLKKWFPDEVKAKQKHNELMAGVDQYGEVYKDQCVVM
ncbi:RING-14 protein-like protein [Lophiostoma macrostomum CBS 122681]|uniref:RING-14 protein-like protein n=1 Tax=Lophiostoma macrostomum CBS 122681 TaxID=1314788 RepID=A0A6A6SNP1_9PLEO|nr:RING-14 protein-like protein [Lophiostoma macrostomum CBS 122681]